MKKFYILIVNALLILYGNAQNVGIGTNNPTYKLDVVGDVNVNTGYGYRVNGSATTGQYLRGDGTRFTPNTIQTGDIPSGSGHYIWNGTTLQTGDFRISGNGSVGSLSVGALTPNSSAALDVVAPDKGVSFPNVDLQGTNLAAPLTLPKKGLVVYNTGTTLSPSGLYINMGTPASPNWQKLSDASGTVGSVGAVTPLQNTGTSTNAVIELTGSVPLSKGGTGLGLGGVANGQLLIGNGTGFTTNTISGTNNQVGVSNGAGSITLSTPQDIATTSNVAFNKATLNTSTDINSLETGRSIKIGGTAQTPGGAGAGALQYTGGKIQYSDGSNWKDLSTTTGTVTSVTGNSPISSSGGATPDISIANAKADASTKGASSFTSNDFDDNGSGNISIDYVNGQKATASQPGFLTATDFSSFNNKWGISGNSGTTAGTNFVGTTDSKDFVVKAGGSANTNERMRFLSGSNTIVVGPGEGDLSSVGAATIIRGAQYATANQAGKRLTFQATNGTGTGGSGVITFETAPAAASSSTANVMVERMRIDNTGNVGIGTNTITQPYTGFTSVEIKGVTNGGLLQLSNNNADGDGVQIGQLMWLDKNSTAADKTVAQIVGSTSGTTANNRGSQLLFGTKSDNGSLITRMQINNVGNVGIGTSTSPVVKLQVSGDLMIGTGTNTYATTPAGSSALTFNGSSLIRMVMNDGQGNFNQYLNSYYDATAVAFKYQQSAAANRFTISGGTYGFYVAPSGTAGNNITWTTAMYMDNSGNVGIGTTGPSVPLDINGSVRIRSANDGSGNIRFDAANPYIVTSGSYIQVPNGFYLYDASKPSYTEAPFEFRNYIQNDGGSFGGDLRVADGLRIDGPITSINNYFPANGAIRLTPNLHLNSSQNQGVFCNWDNGTAPAGNWDFVVGDGAGSWKFLVLYNGNILSSGNYWDICGWTGYSCSPQCPNGRWSVGMEANNNGNNEDCYGGGNDKDEPSRRLYCCDL